MEIKQIKNPETEVEVERKEDGWMEDEHSHSLQTRIRLINS